MKKSTLLIGWLLLVSLFASLSAAKLVINTDTSDPAPKKAFGEVIEMFKKENPDIQVEWNVFDHESYKTAIRNWLPAQAPDVVTWYAGNRMATFVERKLLEDVSDVWRDNNMYSDFSSTKDSMTINNKQWGVPYTYYQWGLYYRKDIFDKYGIKEPKTFNELLAAGKTLRKNGVTPVAIGTKYLWTTAGWFDYLNLRTHGLKFHIDLMLGKVKYTDRRVKQTFANWKKLVDADFFLENHTSYSWQEAQPFLYNGDAAMYLIGNFITPNFPNDVKDKISFMQFPVINSKVPIAEDAPTDTLHIPVRAKNKADARRFLTFFARTDIQEKINATLLQLPANKNAKPANDRFLNAGQEMLGAAAGTAQFYDRDTDPEMAKEGMKGFQEFMVKPQNINRILANLERTRKRIFR